MASNFGAGKTQSSARLKLGFNSYCLRALQWGDIELLDYAAKLKLDAVFLQDSTDPQRDSLAHWKEVGEHARKLGLHVETGVGAVLPQHPSDFERCRQQLLLGIERAKACGSPLVRCLHAGDRAHLPPGPMEQHREVMVKLLRSIRSQAMDAGVKIAIENHKDLQAWEMRETIETAGVDFVGSYLDTGNPVFVVEDPVLTVETLAPYALCLHLRDSVVYQQPGGIAVEWVPLGAGVVDFAAIVKKVGALKPDICVYNKPINGRPPQMLACLEDDFWKAYPKARAAEFARFLALAQRGGPYRGEMVVEDVPGESRPEAYTAALAYQQRQDVEQGLDYARKMLGLGRKST